MRCTALILLSFVLGFQSCSNTKRSSENQSAEFTPTYTPGPKALIYKTKKDYSNLVPVLLSEDKESIESYPHPSDLKVDNVLMVPTKLDEGYLLDNRGIGSKVAFLKYTYQEYAEMPEAPSLDDLFNSIIDKDPLIELCDCGNKSIMSDPVSQLNKLIASDNLRKICKKIK